MPFWEFFQQNVDTSLTESHTRLQCRLGFAEVLHVETQA